MRHTAKSPRIQSPSCQLARRTDVGTGSRKLEKEYLPTKPTYQEIETAGIPRTCRNQEQPECSSDHVEVSCHELCDVLLTR